VRELTDLPDLIRPATLARMVDMTRPVIYARIASGHLRAVRFDGHLRVRRADALAWIEANTQEHVPAKTDTGAAA
jgi:excisionase family DNA binding protein